MSAIKKLQLLKFRVLVKVPSSGLPVNFLRIMREPGTLEIGLKISLSLNKYYVNCFKKKKFKIELSPLMYLFLFEELLPLFLPIESPQGVS